MYKKAAIICLSFIVSFLFALPVSADNSKKAEVPVHVQVNSGPFSIEIAKPEKGSENGPKTITIDGTTQVIPINLGKLTVKDFRGSGKGWKVTVEAEQFTHGTKKLQPGFLKIKGINTITTAEGTSSPLPEVVNDELILDTGETKEILSAKEGTGMGQFDIIFNPIEFTANTSELLTGNYKTTIIYSLVTGP